MSGSWTTSKMGQRHESDVAQALGGRLTRASGSVWQDKTDGKHVAHEVPYAFAWDCKSTTAKSASISLKTWSKLEDQADGLLPALPLRFYADTRLTMTSLDIVAVRLDHFAELLDEANTMARVREAGCLSGDHTAHGASATCEVCGVAL